MSRRVIMCLSLLVCVGGIAGLLSNLAHSAAALDGPDWTTSQAPGSPTASPTASPMSLAVADRVQAIYQGDPTIGWDNQQQYDLWWPSACSPAALTMALRAWGVQVGIGLVLDRLIAHQAITPEHGLLHPEALETVAKEYSFQAITFWSWNLQDVAAVTRQGAPVLIDVVDAKRQTPYPGFVVGHWLVVTSVASDHIEVGDSSGYHIHRLSPDVFHTLFTGIGVVIWKGASISLP